MLADHRGIRATRLAQHVERDPDLRGDPPKLRLPRRSADQAVASTRAGNVGGGLRLLSRPGRACTFEQRAGVAEWQTRQTQNLLPVREWGFKSLHPHQPEPVMA